MVLACAATAWAQQSIDYASVSGRVTDPSGAVVPGAAVSARHQETNLVATTVTDRDGRFRLPYLRVGPYEVAVRADGFGNAMRPLTLTAGAAFELPVTLAVGSLDATVVVNAEATVLEAARSQIAGTVSNSEVQSLPLNGRNFLEVALLIPGVSPTNIASTQLFPETSAVPGVSLSINSQRNLSNSFIVDGLSANDDAAALSGITYGVDAVEQVQVITSSGQAELGRALGGYVNVVTRSGTNTFHGTVYDFVRDDSLNASNSLSGTKLPMSQSQYGGSLGGPAVTDRTFYFVNAEQRRLDQSGLTTIAPENVALVNAHLSAVGYQAPPVTTGIYANPVDSTNVLGKVDHQVSGRDQLGVRYSLYDVSALHSRGAGGLSAPSASSNLDNIDQTVALSNTLTLSPRTVLETRAQYAYSSLEAPPDDPTGPAVSIAGVASFGRLSTSPTGRVNRMFQVVNNLSHQAGSHAVRVGADFLYNDDRITFPRSVAGTYAFSSMASFLRGVYNNAGFSQTFGDTRGRTGQPQRRRLRAGRVEGQPRRHAESRAALRGAGPGDDRHRHRQHRAAAGRDLVALRLPSHARSRRRRAVLRPRAAAGAGQRAALGGQHHRPEQTAPDEHQPVADAGGSAGVSEHPDRRRAVGDPAEPDDHGSPAEERLLAAGQRRGRAPVRRADDGERRLSAPARTAIADGGESERPGVSAGGDQQRLPPEPGLREQQPVLLGRRLQLRRPARLGDAASRPAGASTACPTRCRRRRTTSGSSSSVRRSTRSTSRRTGAGPTTTSGTAWRFMASCTRRWIRPRRSGSTSATDFS